MLLGVQPSDGHLLSTREAPGSVPSTKGAFLPFPRVNYKQQHLRKASLWRAGYLSYCFSQAKQLEALSASDGALAVHLWGTSAVFTGENMTLIVTSSEEHETHHHP